MWLEILSWQYRVIYEEFGSHVLCVNIDMYRHGFCGLLYKK